MDALIGRVLRFLGIDRAPLLDDDPMARLFPDASCKEWTRNDDGSFEILTTAGTTYRLGRGSLEEIEEEGSNVISIGRFLVPESSDSVKISIRFSGSEADAFIRAVYQERGIEYHEPNWG
jgi:hypothetical protein